MTQSHTTKNHAPTGREKLRSKMPTAKAHLIFWPIAILGAATDLWTKHAVFEWLQSRPYNEFSVIDGFAGFVLRENSGAAFSIASGQTSMLIAVSVVALVVVIAIFLFGRIRQTLMLIILAMFTAGITGNLYDRMFNNGFVRDFIDVYYRDYHWPAFNIADSLLCIAVAILVIVNLTSASSQKPAHPQK